MRERSLYGGPMPTTLPAAHKRIRELEHHLQDVLRMLRAHTMQCGTSDNPKTLARIDRAQEVLECPECHGEGRNVALIDLLWGRSSPPTPGGNMSEAADDAFDAALKQSEDQQTMRARIIKDCPRWNCVARLARDEQGLLTCKDCGESFDE